MSLFKWPADSPFGGYKDSGLGRENGIDAMREYLQVKSVWINTGAATANPFHPRPRASHCVPVPSGHGIRLRPAS